MHPVAHIPTLANQPIENSIPFNKSRYHRDYGTDCWVTITLCHRLAHLIVKLETQRSFSTKCAMYFFLTHVHEAVPQKSGYTNSETGEEVVLWDYPAIVQPFIDRANEAYRQDVERHGYLTEYDGLTLDRLLWAGPEW